MKKVLKAVLKATIFVIIFCVIFSGVSYLLVRVDNTRYSSIKEFYNQPEDSLDAVYIGSSNCFAFWNPLFAWNEYGICVYPYACNANPYFSTEYIIKETRKTQPDAAFIVNLNSVSDGELSGMRMHNILSCMPLSLTKLELTNHLCNVAGIEGTDRAEYYIPLIRFHTFTRISKPFCEDEKYMGASAYVQHLELSEDISSDYLAPNETVDLLDSVTSSTDSLLNYCNEENLNIVFVVVPQARDNIYQANRLDALAKYVSSKGYTVINLMGIADKEFNMDMTKDYYDIGHTNIHGSNKYTNYLSKYLIETYGFEDKRGNEDYSHWDTSYKDYMEIASAHILDIEFDYDHRDFDIEEPVFEVKTKNDSAQITWNPIDNADGYLIYKKSDASPYWESIAEVYAESNDLKYTDSKFKKDDPSTYTIVPFAIKDDAKYYGDFNYLGISTAQ